MEGDMRLLHAMSVAGLGLLGFCAIGVAIGACGGSNSATVGDDGGNDGTMASDSPQNVDGTGFGDGPVHDGSPPGDGGLNPDVFGGGDGSTCFGFGNACNANGQCCSNDCSNNLCTYPA